jgi:multiple sugar transport system permease protein
MTTIAQTTTSTRSGMSARTTSRITSTLIYAFLIIGTILMFIPFYWTLITSFMTASDTSKYPIIWFPTRFTLEWVTKAWQAKFPLYYLNSIVVAVFVVISNVLTSSLAGFIFAKYEFPYKNSLFIIILSTMMVPYAVTIIPTYYIVTVWFHLKNSLLAMIIPALISPFGIFLMRQYCETIPSELMDAARIDGASDMRMFVQVILPLCVPALSALAIFHFIWIWNDFLWPLLVADTDVARTLPVGVALFALRRWLQTNLVVAGSLLVMLPLVAVYFVFQRAFVEGIVLTGMKY